MEYYPDFPEERQEGGLVRLSRVRYQLAEGQPDTMGWTAADIEGIVFGKVSDMLADMNTGQIVFVAITHEDTGKTSLVPVEGMFLDLEHELMIMPATEADIEDSPHFTDDVVDVMPFVEYWIGLVLTR